MRTLTLTILTMGMVLAGNARAQTYDPAFPVCMYVVYPRGASYQDCSYYTMAQCAASASGRGFQCSFNPYYAGATASPRRHARRYRDVGSITPVPAGTKQDTYCLQGRAWGYPGNWSDLQKGQTLTVFLAKNKAPDPDSAEETTKSKASSEAGHPLAAKIHILPDAQK